LNRAGTGARPYGEPHITCRQAVVGAGPCARPKPDVGAGQFVPVAFVLASTCSTAFPASQ
jgi:hypothetical protein